jgi:hypothetical protein
LIHRQNPHNATAQSFLGGNLLPCSSSVQIPLDAKPGSWKWKVTVQDRTAKTSATLEGKGKILPADFGIIHVGTFADREGKAPVPPVGVVGSTLYVRFAAVGFSRNAKKDPDLKASLRVLDAEGKPTMPHPLKGQVDMDVPESVKILPMQFAITLNRVGTYTVEITTSCAHSNKTATASFPLRVLAAD